MQELAKRLRSSTEAGTFAERDLKQWRDLVSPPVKYRRRHSATRTGKTRRASSHRWRPIQAKTRVAFPRFGEIW
jgi:hypothetical protein